jgi:hypothetical protein
MNDRIIINAAVLAGKPVIAGTRISVEFGVGLHYQADRASGDPAAQTRLLLRILLLLRLHFI